MVNGLILFGKLKHISRYIYKFIYTCFLIRSIKVIICIPSTFLDSFSSIKNEINGSMKSLINVFRTNVTLIYTTSLKQIKNIITNKIHRYYMVYQKIIMFLVWLYVG